MVKINKGEYIRSVKIIFFSPLGYEVACVVENYFEHKGDVFHENGIYYRVQLPKGLELPEKDEDGKRIIFEWVPVADIESIDLKPTFFKNCIEDLREGFSHVIHRDKEI